MHTTKDDLDSALESNDMALIHEVEQDLHTSLNITRTKHKLAWTLQAKDVLNVEEEYIIGELKRCRAYRQRIDLILMEECNWTQIELSRNK